MTLTRKIWRLSAFIAICLSACVIAILLRCSFWVAGRRQARQRALLWLTQMWARALLGLLGMQVVIQPGGASFATPCLLVSNHQSYLDILIIAAHFRACFVSKLEVSRWPLLGWLAQLGGTIFIERENTLSNVRGVYQASRALRAGAHVQVFPEGTTTNGTQVLPFQPLFFCAALRADRPVLPLTVKFASVNGEDLNAENRELLCWHGETAFLGHFWQLLGVRAAQVELSVHTPLAAAQSLRPYGLARLAYEVIAEEFAATTANLEPWMALPEELNGEFAAGALLYSYLLERALPDEK